MSLHSIIAWVVTAVTAGIAIMALWSYPRSFVPRVFSIAMIMLALKVGFTTFVYEAASSEEFLFRQWLKMIIESCLPAVWLLFSVSFVRANYSEQVAKWKWILWLFLALPLLMVTLFHGAFFTELPVLVNTSTLFIRIGWSGYIWHLLWVLSAVMILMNLERTFRHATGYMKWQTKFMFLGVGGIFGTHLFTNSQVVLFKGVNTGLDLVNLGAILIADILILRSLFRGKPLNASVHLSHQFLYNSFTVLIVGTFFISVGIFAWISVYFEWIKNIHIAILLILVAIMGIAAILLSDRLRMKRKRFISRHFKRPQYDYQKIWEVFTKRTTSLMQVKDLCNNIVMMVSETLQILSVSIWLVDENQERLAFGGSTVFTAGNVENLKFIGRGGSDLIRAMRDHVLPIDLQGRDDDWVDDLKHTYGFEDTKESRIRYCVPLNATGQLIGIMTLSEKVFYEPLSFEDTELVKTIADQSAAVLLNLRLSERLRQTKELEAFQAMSAFFMHDLKNLASKLSLVTQNLPVHIDNPDFRVDALRTITQSVSKINNMSSRLSLLSQKLELVIKETEINNLILERISGIKTYIQGSIVLDLNPVPPLFIDPEQIHKVLENLLINANDALKEDGLIRISTQYRESWMELAVYDNGSGMSKEFIDKNLFRPFQTTKKQGMGIGLYHCKAIIEAHGGRIDVESEEGIGTTFRVLLPAGGESSKGQG